MEALTRGSSAISAGILLCSIAGMEALPLPAAFEDPFAAEFGERPTKRRLGALPPAAGANPGAGAALPLVAAEAMLALCLLARCSSRCRGW